MVIERTVQPHELGRRPWRRLTHGLHGLRGLDVLHLLHGRWLLLLLQGGPTLAIAATAGEWG